MKSFRYWLVVLLLFSTAAIVRLRGSEDRIPTHEPLSQMPERIGPWFGRDIPINPEVIAVLGNGEFLSRLYVSPIGLPPVSLFIGYFPTQRTGQTIHSPKNCLPGAGWVFESAGTAHFIAKDGTRYNTGEYLISNQESRDFVTYWYQAHDRSTPGEYMAKVRMVMDAIRMNRTDGALVRVITPMEPNETYADAKNRALSFDAEMAPQLSRFIPR